MGSRRKAIRAGILFIALLIISGVVLMYRGNDAVVLATLKKDGILTAEQIKLSFDSVGGRLINEAVREGQEVKAGQVVMELDPTDTNLAIEKLKAQIAQLDAQINSTSGNMTQLFSKPTTTSNNLSAKSTANAARSRRHARHFPTPNSTSNARRNFSKKARLQKLNSTTRRWL